MGKWFSKEDKGEEQCSSERAGVSGSLAGGGTVEGGGWRSLGSVQVRCAASGRGSRARAPSADEGGGWYWSPGSRKSARTVAGGVFWFCFQKYSNGLAATFKDLKICKQALGKRSPKNSSSEYGKC